MTSANDFGGAGIGGPVLSKRCLVLLKMMSKPLPLRDAGLGRCRELVLNRTVGEGLVAAIVESGLSFIPWSLR